MKAPKSYTLTVRVTDDGTPTLPDEETISVTIRERPNRPPNDFNGDGKSEHAMFRPVDDDWSPYGLARWYTLINRSDKGAELYDWARQWGLGRR